MSDGVFDSEVAPGYDADVAERFDPAWLDPEVDFLAELALGRRVLEFAVGTGRVALPLARRGLDVAGIELSRAMTAELAGKPDGERVEVTLGDMTSTRVPGEFGLVFLVFNTITNLPNQDAQVACFENAAAHLAPGGCFVVETGIPRLQRLAPGERFVPFDVTDEHIGIDEYDVTHQRLTSHHLFTGDGRVRRFSSTHRYAWPAELDLMARLAGLRLRERWADWHRTPLTAASTMHVSVWEKPVRPDGIGDAG